MSDSKNIRDLKPEESWLKAEKMLDRHFRKKKIFIWSLSFFVTALVVVCTTVIMNHFSEDVASQNKNILPGQTVDKSSVPKQEGASAIVKNADETKGIPEHAFNEPKGNRPEIGKAENKSAGDKSELITQRHLQNTESDNHKRDANIHRKLMGNSKVQDIQSEGAQVNISERNVESTSSGPEGGLINSIIKDEKIPNLQLRDSDPDLAYLNTIYTGEVSYTVSDQYSVSDLRSENKNVSLPGGKYDLKLLMYGSAQYVFKTIESKNFPDYATRRKKEEQGIITSSIGASLLCEVKKFSMSIGIEYSSWGEKNIYSPYLVKKIDIENGGNQPYYRDVTDTLYISGNQYFHLYQVQDSMFVSHIDTVTKSMYDQQVSSVNGVSKFYFIEIPVEFSYHFTCSKIGFGATVGISPAWLLNEKGYYLKRDLSGVELLSEIQSADKFTINGRFSLDFYYRLNERINFLVRSQMKTSFGSVFQKDYDVNQRYYSTGLVFGLLYSIK